MLWPRAKNFIFFVKLSFESNCLATSDEMKFICQSKISESGYADYPEFQLFTQQIIENLPENETEIVKFLKYVQQFGFLKKKRFLSKA